ncbi:TIGR02281 family clan AA aspartic protease [Phenylobacterium sp.]|jgi:aspartyl protease family protein|uniref:TIGR02281 family clan AA aspartic protease n=1 Tax=Phenylobacterium sp. TaxID=1871053 RepID=UPI002F4174CD
MLRFTLIALAGAVTTVGAAQAVTVLAPLTKPAAMVATMAPAPAAAEQAASISKASDGHYWAEADVNGARVRFLVDTGATAVALTALDAQRLGFAPKDLDYTYQVTTANGPARAAAVKLASVSVAGARVANVDALVIEKGLDTSLLGMTYLGRLSRFEATRSSLILRP